MIAFGDSTLGPDISKMMIYRIHQLRVLTAVILLAATFVLLIVLNPPYKCIRVSVSVRQWRLPVKRTRFVLQGLEEEDGSLSDPKKELFRAVNSAWFRTRIILPPSSEDNDVREVIEEEIKEEEGVKEEEEEEEEEAVLEEEKDDEDETNEDEYYNENDLPENKIFEDGDFDYNDTYKRGPDPDFGVILRIFQEDLRNGNSSRSDPSGQSSRQETELKNNYRKSLRRKWRNITLVNVEGVPIVEDGIFWSEELERRTPKGATDEEAESALKKLRSLKVQRVESPTWNRCGRPKNQFVVFEDGSKACARYRAPHQYLVQGEVLSFYLSRLLGIDNVPPVSLAVVRPDFQGMWNREVVQKDLLASKWEVNTTVALIQWIENLERDKMPSILLSALENREPLSSKSSTLLTLLTEKLTELLQWSDLIIFDYITGNYDRVASMQDAADKEGKPSILRETVHNLVRSKSTGGLWLIDNESGLLDSYSLLYGTSTGKDGRFVEFHRRMLNTTCLFRRRTAERIQWLHSSDKAGQILMNLVKQMEPLFTPVKREKEVGKQLQQRIAEVHEHIKQCKAMLS